MSRLGRGENDDLAVVGIGWKVIICIGKWVSGSCVVCRVVKDFSMCFFF